MARLGRNSFVLGISVYVIFRFQPAFERSSLFPTMGFSHCDE